VSDGKQRRWFAGNEGAAAGFDGGPDRGIYDLGISPTLINLVSRAGGNPEDFALIHDPEHSRIGVRSPVYEAWSTDLQHPFPDLSEHRLEPMLVGGSASVRAGALDDAICAVLMRWQLLEERPENDPRCVLGVGDGVIGLVAKWEEVGPVTVDIPVDDVSGSVAVEVNPELLQRFVRLFRPEDEIEVEIPLMAGHPVGLSSENLWISLMPYAHPMLVIRDAVEAVITETMGSLAAQQDADGDYPLVRRQTPVYARLDPEPEPPTLRVFAVVLSGIEASPELMTELNDLNVNGTFARVFHVDDEVRVQVDLLAETLDPVELRTAIDRIGDLAQRIMPTLAAVFGGDLVDDPAARRLELYRSTVVEAETSPGLHGVLNGSDAVEDWPFPGTAYVITGWNPQGVEFDEDHMQDVNVMIATDILRSGGRFVHGIGRSPDGEHEEPSLVAWDIERCDARTFGQRASQDAIFEIDADEVRLVSCYSDDVETWPRRPKRRSAARRRPTPRGN
jgi:hypothetical protein